MSISSPVQDAIGLFTKLPTASGDSPSPQKTNTSSGWAGKWG